MQVSANYFHAKQPANIDEVLAQLGRLERDLPNLGLPLLRNFNYTYLIITRNVRRAARDGHFSDRTFLNTFDCRFAQYYLTALRHYLRQEAVAPAWQVAFQQAQTECCTPFVLMALGVNAHVNNDIPLALLDCGAKARHHDDYHRVNGIIEVSLAEVIEELDAAGNLADPKRSLLTPPYKVVMKQLIKTWRDNAWQSFESLKRQQLSVDDIEQAAHKMANRLLALPL